MEQSTEKVQETVERAQLISELLKPGKSYELGNETFRFVLQKEIIDPDKIFESGRIIVVDTRGTVVAHVDFSINYRDSEIAIVHKGYGESGDDDESAHAKELQKNYGRRGIVSTATSLIAEYGIYSSVNNMIGFIGKDNSNSLNSRQKMKKIVGQGEYDHDPDPEKSTKDSTLLRTFLQKRND